MSERATFPRMEESSAHDCTIARLTLRDEDHVACALCDNPAFDAKAQTQPIETFTPLLRRVCAQPCHSIYKAAMPAA